MRKRITRGERTGQNRDQVLAAARKVFLASGYERATLDAIAEEAGFSKGVVYSQFGGKGDLFLALLAERIAARRAQNEALAKRHSGLEGIRAVVRATQEDGEEQTAWRQVLLEFRLHAARDRELNRRYAQMHEHTIDGIASVMEKLLRETGDAFVESPRHLAVLTLAFSSGLLLEGIADSPLPRSVGERALRRLIAREVPE